jgi:hypothetical protein
VVKMPSFDDLKKAGANLVDSAKSGRLVDDIKARIENVGERLTKDGAEMPQGQFPIKEQFQTVYATLKDLYQLQSQQAEMMKRLETQLGVLAKVVEAETTEKVVTSKPVVVVAVKTEPTSTPEPVVIKTEEKKEP